MKRYLIKDELVATEKNSNFAGEQRTYWMGVDAIREKEDNLNWLAKIDGYKTKAGATRGLKKHRELAEWETARGFWKHTSVELVEFEVAE